MKLLLAALVLSNKYLMDDTYHNKAWSVVSGFANPSQVCAMERELASLLGWNLYINRRDWILFLDRASQGIHAVSCEYYGVGAQLEEFIKVWDCTNGRNKLDCGTKKAQ